MKYQAITTVIDVKTTYDPVSNFSDIHDVLSVTAHYKIYILVILLSILSAFVFEINVMLIINTIPNDWLECLDNKPANLSFVNTKSCFFEFCVTVKAC